MLQRAALLFFLAAATAGGKPAFAGKAAEGPFMPMLGEASSPVGYISFCTRHPFDCVARTRTPVLVTLDDDRWLDLLVVNRSVNSRVAPATDQEVYGVEEYWEYPIDRGDCEDYVLLKRKELIERGWPPSTVLITVVRDENGDGHAVLTVRTDHGDLVLDNKVEIIRPWFETPYTYIKRQSVYDAMKWTRIDDRRSTASVASIRRRP